MDTPRNLPRDTFLYLLSLITLIVSAISFGVLLFQYINIYFPDVLERGYSYGGFNSYRNQIRFALATLVVLFPVYAWSARVIRRDILENPEKRELKLRKWLLYFTVFVAGLVIIGDLVGLINNYLLGELTIRFVLKVLSILFIAGSIFYYYFSQLRESTEKRSYRMALWPKVIIGVVAAVVVFGFYLAGSPQSQRLTRFDERRVSDLQIIQGQLISYWQTKHTLPAGLSNLEDDISGFRVPRDPKTNQSYEYQKEANLKFSLCAAFDTKTTDQDEARSAAPYPYRGKIDPYSPENWEHGVGRQCFTRTIDPDRYPPLNSGPRI